MGSAPEYQFFPRLTRFQPFTLKISLVILLTVCHTVLVIWDWRNWERINYWFPTWYFSIFSTLLYLILYSKEKLCIGQSWLLKCGQWPSSSPSLLNNLTNKNNSQTSGKKEWEFLGTYSLLPSYWLSWFWFRIQPLSLLQYPRYDNHGNMLKINFHSFNTRTPLAIF